MSRKIKELFKNEKIMGRIAATFTMLVLVVTVASPSTFAEFWRTVPGGDIYDTGLANANLQVYGYGYGSRQFGYGYGYGYGVNDEAGYYYETGSAAFNNPSPVTGATIASNSTITGSSTAASVVFVKNTVSFDSGSTQVVIPSSTGITKSGGGTFDATSLAVSATGTIGNNELETSLNIVNSDQLTFGATSAKLLFDRPIQINIPTSIANGTTVKIKAQHFGETSLSTASLASSDEATCSAGAASPSATSTTVASGLITFYTCAASEFVGYETGSTISNTTTTTTTSSGGGGGGGGGWSPSAAKKSTTVATEDTEAATEDFEAGEVAPKFKDINNHWAEDYIETLRVAGIIHGKKTGVFGPNDQLTRAELTKIALNAFDIDVASSVAAPFKDVAGSAWYGPYVAKAKSLGIVGGYGDGTFKPNQSINRAEALKILLKAADANISSVPIQNHFNDVANNAWFAGYVSYAKVNGIVGGYGNGDFGPGNPVLRSEMAKMAVKTMNLLK